MPVQQSSLLFFLSALWIACTPQPAAQKDTALSDTMQIWTDTSIRAIVNEQKKSFENIYSEPFLNLQFLNEAEIVDALLNNRINTAVLHRELSTAESEHLFKKENFRPKQYIFAWDAYVLLASVTGGKTYLEESELSELLLGKSRSSNALAVESASSQAVEFLSAHFGLKNKGPLRLSTPGGLDHLLRATRSNPDLVAVIPFSYISDPASAETDTLLKGLRVLSLRYRDSTGAVQTVMPSQETIATREYPLISPLVFVNCNMEEKSGTKFVNFLFKPRAQRLILKCGLVPAIFPGREVIIYSK